MKFSKKALGRGALGSYFLGCFKKKKIINQNFQLLKKNENKKLINKNFQFLQKIHDFQIFQKKKNH